jgi:hypothetical protein
MRRATPRSAVKVRLSQMAWDYVEKVGDGPRLLNVCEDDDGGGGSGGSGGGGGDDDDDENRTNCHSRGARTAAACCMQLERKFLSS